METQNLILFFFLLILISIIGLSLSGARVEIRTLKDRLDRWGSLDVKSLKSNAEPPTRLSKLYANLFTAERVIYDRERHIARQVKEIGALEHTIALKGETIKHLGGDIAKLKFDYAAEVAGRNDPKRATIEELRTGYGGAPLRGEWVDELSDAQYKKPIEIEVTCRTCDGSGTFLDDTVCQCCGGEGSVKIDA